MTPDPTSPAYNKPSPSAEINANFGILTEHFDQQYARGMIENLGNICHETYFRSRFIGFNHHESRMDETTPLIFISNHSGMAFPWDAIVYGSVRNHEYQFDKGGFRMLVAPILSETSLMNPFMIHNLWKKVGGIDATFLNFETLMHQDTFDVAMYPEGIPGIGKGFNRKYQLQRFATSFVRLSIKYRTDVIWVSTINAEYINPYSFSWEWLNHLSKKIGIPFLPVSLMLVAVVLQPWVFYFAFPAKLTYVRGPRMSPWKMTDKSYDELTDQDFENIALQVRAQAQEHINECVKQYGKSPFRLGEFFTALWKNRKHFPFYLPITWPLIYTDFDKQYRKHEGLHFTTDLSFWGFIKMIFRNPIYVAFFIPILGWIPLVIKGYKGHQINANERRRAQSQKQNN